MKTEENRNKNSKRLHRWLRFATVYLLVITLVSTGLSFASYTTSVDITSDPGAVAVFAITTTLENGTVTLDTTDSAKSETRTFTVTNSSEVAVNCTVRLSGIPEGVTVTSNMINGTVSDNTAVPVGVLTPGATSASISLTFTVPKETEISATDISITVYAVQVD